MTLVDDNLKVEHKGDKLYLEIDPMVTIENTSRGNSKVIDANWVEVHTMDDEVWVLKAILIRKKARRRQAA